MQTNERTDQVNPGIYVVFMRVQPTRCRLQQIVLGAWGGFSEQETKHLLNFGSTVSSFTTHDLDEANRPCADLVTMQFEAFVMPLRVMTVTD